MRPHRFRHDDWAKNVRFGKVEESFYTKLLEIFSSPIFVKAKLMFRCGCIDVNTTTGSNTCNSTNWENQMYSFYRKLLKMFGLAISAQAKLMFWCRYINIKVKKNQSKNTFVTKTRVIWLSGGIKSSFTKNCLKYPPKMFDIHNYNRSKRMFTTINVCNIILQKLWSGETFLYYECYYIILTIVNLYIYILLLLFCENNTKT